MIENAKIRKEGHSRFQLTGIVTKEKSSPVKNIKILINMPTLPLGSDEFLIWQPKNEVCRTSFVVVGQMCKNSHNLSIQILRGENMVCELGEFETLPSIESLRRLTGEREETRSGLRRVTRQESELINHMSPSLRIVSLA